MKFVIRKIIEANSAQEAIRKDKNYPVLDCYLHPEKFNKLALEKEKTIKGF